MDCVVPGGTPAGGCVEPDPPVPPPSSSSSGLSSVLSGWLLGFDRRDLPGIGRRAEGKVRRGYVVISMYGLSEPSG